MNTLDCTGFIPQGYARLKSGDRATRDVRRMFTVRRAMSNIRLGTRFCSFMREREGSEVGKKVNGADHAQAWIGRGIADAGGIRGTAASRPFDSNLGF